MRLSQTRSSPRSIAPWKRCRAPRLPAPPGAIMAVPDFDTAVPVIDRIAPEHLELALDDPHALAAKVRNAGAVFLGRHSPEAVGDYVAGPNHVLPTSGAARYASGLGVLDFMKRTTLIDCSAEGVAAIG